jgi:predicted nucleotide-binding protein
MDLAKYVETSIRESDIVLLICTPTFAKKVNNREGVVGFENQIIAGEILEGSFSSKQVVPILRKGNRKKSIPSYVKGKVYIDFRDDKVFDEKLKDLLGHIFKSSAHSRLHHERKPTLNYSTIEKRTNVARS